MTDAEIDAAWDALPVANRLDRTRALNNPALRRSLANQVRAAKRRRARA